ncbi:MAG: tRNA (guanosine(46)-N7)-methyltransferase TrmB [Defluviitaleaceae bacterium]|nr:tRNA (guanosine(46)-N7)-methyltransferase TrmB [Defluviitaleaceae bacterium]MCL2262557.1 tRNA (guanosine(46)-N7)-methyltransferase TrmB [Defluviitaleaceae bacterium]
MRTRKKKWSAGELENNPRILRNESEYFGRLTEYFNDGKPIHLEIGCGKGRFIIETSRREPDINFVAVERDETILATAARRAEEKAAGSIAFVVADVNDGLEFIKSGEISRLYINFCDPWSRKKKWAKRRLTYDTFLELYEKLKIPEIFFKTDNRVLFESSLESFSRKNWLVKNISLDLHASNFPENIMTEYEEKFSAHGPIYRLEAELR